MSNWRKHNLRESGRVIVLEVIRVERPGVDLSRQTVRPSSDRRRVIDLQRVKTERDVEAELRQALLGPRR